MTFTLFPDDLFKYLSSSYEQALMLRILYRCGFDGQSACFETRTNMCAALGMAPKTWTRTIKDLEAKGLIKVARHPKTPHQITLTDLVKELLWGKKYPLKINTIDTGYNLPLKEKKKAVRKRPAKDNGHSVNIETTSEIERIHSKWLKKQDSSD